MKRTVRPAICLATLFLSIAALVNAAGTEKAKTTAPPKAVDDKTFVQEAASGGMMEVALGKVAQDKAVSADVKTLGQQMVTDHSKLNDQITALAQQKGITLEPTMMSEHQAHVTRLSNLPTEKFDLAYTRFMIMAHRKDIGAFKREIAGGSDTETKNLASAAMPTLQEHLKMAMATYRKLGGKMRHPPSRGDGGTTGTMGTMGK